MKIFNFCLKNIFFYKCLQLFHAKLKIMRAKSKTGKQ